MARDDDKVVGFSPRDAERLLSLIVTGETPVRMYRPTGGMVNIIAKTPVGGIAARTGSGPWTPGVATCTLCEQYDDGGTWKIREKSPTEDVVVYNSSPHALAASAPIQAKPIGGKYYVDVAECV